MLFNSATYLVFLLAVVLVYWQLPQRGRLWLIFVASLIFYGFWRVEFIPLLLFSALLDYFLALVIARTEDERKRFRMLVISIVLNLGILFFFKYLIFFRDSIFSLASLIGYQPSYVELNIILPLGISFYIFATISYVVDVYRREFPAERDLLTYVCFVVYFPHLVAGPILRARSLIPQLKAPEPINLDLVSRGIARIAAGLFLKVVLADPIGGLVDDGFTRDPSSLGAFDGWTLAFLFGFQIYFDFCAYSHIAIGSSLLLGVTLPENFNFPYLAANPRDFWRRWHISLSTWIRDYVYLPLAGSYRSPGLRTPGSAPEPGLPREQRTMPLFVTWALMGLWHGANWTFVVWGLFHATAVYLHRMVSKAGWVIDRMPGVLGWAVTLPVMMAGWIPFRAPSLEHTLVLWGRMIDPRALPYLTLLPISYVTAAAVMVGVVIAGLLYERRVIVLDRFTPAGFASQCVFYAVVFAGIIVFLQVRSQFIYFQF